MTNASLRQRLAASLESDAHRQLTGATDFGREYDELDTQVPRDNRTLMLALQFWDAWIDEHEHGFPNRYDGIGNHDWPRLALTLSRSLRTGEVIQDPLLLRHFAVRTPVSLPEWLLHLVRRRRHNK
jgi:hypothetical protein